MLTLNKYIGYSRGQHIVKQRVPSPILARGNIFLLSFFFLSFFVAIHYVILYCQYHTVDTDFSVTNYFCLHFSEQAQWGLPVMSDILVKIFVDIPCNICGLLLL